MRFITANNTTAKMLRRLGTRWLYRQPKQCFLPQPVISFTFDDFPHSAMIAASILEQHGVRGTFYTSLGLMGKTWNGIQYFNLDDLHQLLDAGHEIGCHTYHHYSGLTVSSKDYAGSNQRNRESIANLFPALKLVSFAYPYGVGAVTPANKRDCGIAYTSCRSTLMGINKGVVDLAFLKANPLYGALATLDNNKKLIADNYRQNGWLIFYSHDIETAPAAFGCTQDYFTQLVAYAVDSGTQIEPVCNVVAKILV